MVRRDLALGAGRAGEPLQKSAPIPSAEQDDWEVRHCAGAGECENLEEFIQRADASGQDRHALGMAQEHRLANSERMEGDSCIHVRVDRVRAGQHDAEAEGSPASVLGSFVGRRHQTRAAARDDGVPGRGQAVSQLLGSGVLGAFGRGPARADHRDSRPQPGQAASPDE